MANVENATLNLYDHQREAYENAEELFENGRYAAVIFPTGCGKSFVTLEYILQHPNQRILFLSPRNAIKEQMYEYVVRYIGGLQDSVEEIQRQYGSMKKCAQTFIPNLECMLYQTILGIEEKDSVDAMITKLNPDIIIVDEMHHLKTKRKNKSKDAIRDDDDTLTEEEKEEQKRDYNEWGKKFQRLLELYPDAKVLGLSATPVRNDGANVVERLFENSIAEEISLLEAMEEGIIIPPRYVTPDFLEEDELETLLQQIENAKGNKKEALKQRYDELVEQSSNIQGIPELLDEYITDRNGKYIIFCRNIQDMEEKQKQAEEWFGKIDSKPEIYRVSTKHSDSQQQLDNFSASDSEHIKLLYCVGMIDEGVHLNGISGVILTVKTGSRPAYLQRLGRAISSGTDKKQALVIDLVNNNEILFEDREKNPEYGYEITDIESLQKLIDWIKEKNNGKLPEDTKEKTTRERAMARRLIRLHNKYFKYIENPKLLEDITDSEKRQEIEDILLLGMDIELWDESIVNEGQGSLEIDEHINDFLTGLEIKGNRIDLRKLLNEARENNISPYLQNAREIADFYEKEGRLPSLSIKAEAKERKLASELQTIRIYVINPYKELGTEEEKKAYIAKLRSLTEEQFMEIVAIIEEIDRKIGRTERKKRKTSLQRAREIKEFYEREGRLPSQSQKAEAEERELANALQNIRSGVINPYKELGTKEEKKEYVAKLRNLTEEQFMEILGIIEEIDRKTGRTERKKRKTSLQNAREIEEFYKREGRLPSKSKNAEVEERSLGNALNRIRTKLINPYKKLRTEEEKKAYIAKLRTLTEEQFIEILGIIEGIETETAEGKSELTEARERKERATKERASAKELEARVTGSTGQGLE